MKRVATVAVIHDGQLLMGKRRDSGKFTTPGGHLEEGESPLAGAVRELREESGIVADPKEFSQVRNETVTKPDGTKIQVFAFRLDLQSKPSTSMSADPDVEVHRWHWVSVPLKKEIADNLHVPMKDNVLMKGLNMEKTAFWNGFDKQAGMLSNVAGKVMASPLAGKAMNAGIRGAQYAKANPGKMLAGTAALAGGAGYMAGRQSTGPRYPY